MELSSSTFPNFTQNLIAQCNACCTVDLSPVRTAQQQVHQALLSAGAGERLARLAKADLLETCLTRAVEVIKEAPRYRKLPKNELRVSFLALHLEVSIVVWLRDRAQTSREVSALEKTQKIILGTQR